MKVAYALVAIAFISSYSHAQNNSNTCELYPIGIPGELLNGNYPIFLDISTSEYRWLSWSGSLADIDVLSGLNPPGNDSDYINPYDSSDTTLDSTDWVWNLESAPSKSDIASQIDGLIGQSLTVPVVSPQMQYNSDNISQVTDFITVEINSYSFKGKSDTIAITVQSQANCAPQNTAPRANDLDLTTHANTAKDFQLLAVDDEGDELSYNIQSQPNNGLLEGVAPNLTYHPNDGFIGNDSFTYKVSDGLLESGVASVNIAVDALRLEPPIAINQNITVASNSYVEFELTTTTSNPAQIEYEIIHFPDNGTIQQNGDHYRFTPNTDFQGIDQLTFIASSGEVISNIAEITFYVKGEQNLPPKAFGARKILFDNIYGEWIDVQAFDSDSENLRAYISKAPQVSEASTSSTNPMKVYFDLRGVDELPSSESFHFIISDGESSSEPTVAWVEYRPAEFSPKCTIYPFIFSDSFFNESTTGDSFSKVPPGEDNVSFKWVTWERVTQGISSSWFDPNKHLNFRDPVNPMETYPSVGNWVQKIHDSTLMKDYPDFSYIVGTSAAIPVYSQVSSVTEKGVVYPTYKISGYKNVTITDYSSKGSGYISFTYHGDAQCDNVKPSPPSVKVTGTEDQSITIPFANLDAEGDQLKLTISSQPSYGTVSISGNTVVYTPDDNFNGVDTFEAILTDYFEFSETGIVVVSVQPAPDSPVIQTPPAEMAFIGSMYSPYIEYYDPDGDTITFALTSGPDGMTIDSEGFLKWNPTEQQEGVHEVVITITDSTGLSFQHSFLITVTYPDTDKDGVEDRFDFCPKSHESETVDLNGCSDTQLATVERLDISKVPSTGVSNIVEDFDDAYYRPGVIPKFQRDHTNQVVTDLNTKLQWHDSSSTATQLYNFTEATQYCEQLEIDGNSNWRVPSVKQLSMLVYYNEQNNSYLDKAFNNTSPSYYWTNYTKVRSYEYLSGEQFDKTVGALVSFSSGKVIEGDISRNDTKVDTEDPEEKYKLRCVSGEEDYGNEFNGFVDASSHLAWSSTVISGTWHEAADYCANYSESYANTTYEDWRLPTLKEIQHIADNSYWKSKVSYKAIWSSTLIESSQASAHVYGTKGWGYISHYTNILSSNNYWRCITEFPLPIVPEFEDITVLLGEIVYIDGSESYHENGQGLLFDWRIKGSTNNTLYQGNEPAFSISSLDLGTNAVTLTVKGTNNYPITRSFNINVLPNPDDTPPTADAGGAISVLENESFTLDASMSYDNYGIVSYEWRLDGALVGSERTFTSSLDTEGEYLYELTVMDTGHLSSTDTVLVTVSIDDPQPPIALAGSDSVVSYNDTVTLNASQSSDDKGIRKFEWYMDGVLVGTTATVSFEGIPEGKHTFDLVITDLGGNTATDSVTVWVVSEEKLTFRQCPSNYINQLPDFVDIHPDENIQWIGENYSDVIEIEKAFNHARRIDAAINVFLKMPSQQVWDSWSLEEQGLYLVNSERIARGIKPFRGADPDIAAVTGNFASYLVQNNEEISHSRSYDGASPVDRLNENPTLQDSFTAISENLARVYNQNEKEALVASIYMWIYADKVTLSGNPWGHRGNILDNKAFGSSSSEMSDNGGIIGFGVSSGLYDPYENSPTITGQAVVHNNVMPISGWDYSTLTTVSTANAHQCANEMVLKFEEGSFPSSNLSAISINPSAITLPVGATARLKVTGHYNDGGTIDLTDFVYYIEGPNSIAYVDAGTINAIKPGTDFISAQFENIKSASIPITVLNEPSTVNAATEFSNSHTSYIADNASHTFEGKLFSLITGYVFDDAGQPIENAIVSIVGKSQYGTVNSDLNGQYILAVEAGTNVVHIEKAGYTSVQRRIITASKGWNRVDDVTLLPKDTKVSVISLTGGVERHVSSPVTDERGTRSTTVVFDNISQAIVRDSIGNTRVLDELLLSATEYRTPASMPGVLPKETAFTYCAEFSVAGVNAFETVEFDNDVVIYLDNYLNFPVGEIIPIGYYDNNLSEWIALENGIVVRLLDTDSDGLVDGLDYSEDGIPDDLDGDGSTSDEVNGIENYTPDSVYWRGTTNHFSAVDMNFSVDLDSEAPEEVEVEGEEEEPENQECESVSSYIKSQSQELHEDVPIAGSNITLHYATQRTADYQHEIRVKISDEALPTGVINMIAVVDVAGHRFTQEFPPQTSLTTTFSWDGYDIAGNRPEGEVKAYVSIGYQYYSEYYGLGNTVVSGLSPDEFPTAWAVLGAEPLGIEGREVVTSWRNKVVSIFNVPKSHIAHGWSLSNHHIQTPYNLVYLGNGEAESAYEKLSILKTGLTLSVVEGDDGYYQRNGFAIDYDVDNQGNLIDKVTGLTWQYLDGYAPLFSVKQDAIDYCSSLSDSLDPNEIWRLPTSKEANYTIDKSGQETGALQYHIDARSLWKESTADTGNAHPALCVKGEKLDDRYITAMERYEAQEVVVDVQTGLMWQDDVSTVTDTFTWSESVAHCEALEFAGYDDWRLPNVNELLFALPNDTFVNQTVLTFENDELWLPGVSWRKPYWTSTPNVSNPLEESWAVESLSYSYNEYSQSQELFHTRCVRTDSSLSSSPYIFDDNGLHTATIDTLTGKTLETFNYDQNDLLVSVVDQFGNTIALERDANGNVDRIVTSDGYVTDLTIDGAYNLESVRYPDNGEYTFIYNGSLMAQERDPENNLFTRQFDDKGRITQSSDPEGGVWNFYDYWSNNTRTYGYTTAESNRYESVIEQLLTGEQQKTTTFKSGVQRVATSSDERTQTNIYGASYVVNKEWDTVTQKWRPIQITTTLPSTRTSTSTLTYGELPNGAGRTVSFTSGSRTSTMTNNTSSGTLVESSPEGRVTTQIYDVDTLQPKSTGVSGLLPVAYKFDQKGRVKSTTQGTRVQSYTYDDANFGELSSVTNAAQQTTEFDYDAMGRVSEIRYPGTRSVTFTYDKKGNLSSLKPSGQPVHYFDYNSVDQETDYIPPVTSQSASTSTTYTYDKDRRLRNILRPDSQQINFVYVPAKDALATVTIPRGSYSYGYNSFGQVNTITNPDGNILQYDYDGPYLTDVTYSGEVAGSVNLDYNTHFEISQICVNDFHCTHYLYDGDGLPTTIGVQALEYRVDNTLLDSTTIGNLNTSYQYNSYGEQTFESVDLNESNLFNVTYTRDDLGRIESKVVNTPSYSHTYGYTYTQFGHLETETVNGITTTYTYDDNGNRLTRSVGSDVEQGVVDEQDRLLSYGDCTYTYSLNGELASKTCAQVQSVYSYDVMGNLLEVGITDTSTQESKIISYGVDAQDRRIAKYVDGVKVYGLLYSDQLSPIAMLDGDNNVTATFIYGTRMNVPDYMVKDGISYKFITDQLGSPLMLVDTSTGNIAQQLTYDAFGRVLSDSNPGFQPFGFAGGLYDKGTGLVRFGARDYDADAGRWVSKDPIRFHGRGTNLYEYVSGNPVEFVDFDGLMKVRAYRTRAGGNGVHYRYSFSFSPIANPNTYAARFVANANRLANFVNFIKPSAAGPNISSVKGYLECGALDHKFQQEFSNMTGAGANDLLTRKEALVFLKEIQKQYRSEYNLYYPEPEVFLQEAVDRGSDNWFNQINSGDY